jgi:hypothetical protein
LITNEINELDGNAPDSASGTVSTADTAASTAPSESNTATAPGRPASSAGPIGSFDPSAIASLIGDTAVLGTLPAGAVVSLTDALSGAALDLGSGEVADAGKFFADTVRGGFVLAESRIANDLNTIKTHFAELTGTSNPTDTAQDTAVRSTIVTADHKTAAPAPTTSQRTDTTGRTDPTVPAAKPVTATHNNAAASDSAAATSATSTKTPTGPKHALREGSKTVSELTGRDGTNASGTKAAASAPTKTADQGSKTTKPGNSIHGQNHAPGGKHRK